jgi:hypothetical protein
VEDGVNLQKQNLFYKDVKEGDYILIYKDVAVVYDLRSNTIVAMRKTSDSEREVGKEQVKTVTEEAKRVEETER